MRKKYRMVDSGMGMEKKNPEVNILGDYLLKKMHIFHHENGKKKKKPEVPKPWLTGYEIK